MNTPKVSIISVCRNILLAQRQDSFLQMLHSIANQSLENIELVIIDGASNDGSIEFIQEQIHSVQTKYKLSIEFLTEPDTGIYNAMNKGVKQSTGEYVLFINTDDYLYSEGVIEAAVTKLSHSHRRVCFGSAEIIDNTQSNTKQRVFTPNVTEYLFKIPCSHQAIICHKDLFIEHDYFDESFKYAADYDFISKVLRSNEPYSILDEIISSYRIDGVTGSTASHQLLCEENMMVIKKNFSAEGLITTADITKLLNENFKLKDFFHFKHIIKDKSKLNVIRVAVLRKVLRKRLGKGIYNCLIRPLLSKFQ